MPIPKRIIHIYSRPAGESQELPLVCQASLKSTKLLHPDFEFVLFDRERIATFVREEFPEYVSVIEEFKFPIQRFDFFRYLAVYRLGGFYFDLDIFMAESVHHLLNENTVLTFEELTLSRFLREKSAMDWELANYGFGAHEGDPFIKKVIEYCVRSLRDPEWASLMLKGIPSFCRNQFVVPMSTGPGAVSRAFAENRDLQPAVTVLMPSDVRDPDQWHRFGGGAVHLQQSSWRARDSILRRRLTRLWEVRERKLLNRESETQGPTREGLWKSLRPPLRNA